MTTKSSKKPKSAFLVLKFQLECSNDSTDCYCLHYRMFLMPTMLTNNYIYICLILLILLKMKFLYKLHRVILTNLLRKIYHANLINTLRKFPYPHLKSYIPRDLEYQTDERIFPYS
ncbi:hypothetical protein KIN20_006033 [Parelaphostrongylus tenuis]|uniref:Uncharacterized protein n=1 Tax=Parelaphostrongylus tenuis TaxID=148309 RepID=A0AAD5QGE3_PARTN|nr:hypothetical protein KIN20_006033 [Parelaphostrongylus tenuis]